MTNEEVIANQELRDRMDFLFGIGPILGVFVVAGGYLCRNFEVRSRKGRFFLKQYRKRTSAWVHEIKFAEKFFAEGGIPIILPVKDRFGRRAFWFEGNWYSLFPYVDGSVPAGDELTETTVASIGEMLGHIHQIGSRERFRPFQPFAHWDYDRFHLEYVEIEQSLKGRRDSDAFLARVREVARLKYDLVQKYRQTAKDYLLPFDHLLHGDFIYQNTYINDRGEVSHVYDLERTCVGPRAFELGRSMMINCFDKGWEEKNFTHARAMIMAYQSIYPIDFEEFKNGIWMYFLDLIHSNSMEAKYLLYGLDQHLKLYEAHARRIERLSETDLDAFCRDLHTGA